MAVAGVRERPLGAGPALGLPSSVSRSSPPPDVCGSLSSPTPSSPVRVPVPWGSAAVCGPGPQVHSLPQPREGSTVCRTSGLLAKNAVSTSEPCQRAPSSL